jgi:hypothetical protein
MAQRPEPPSIDQRQQLSGNAVEIAEQLAHCRESCWSASFGKNRVLSAFPRHRK